MLRAKFVVPSTFLLELFLLTFSRTWGIVHIIYRVTLSVSLYHYDIS